MLAGYFIKTEMITQDGRQRTISVKTFKYFSKFEHYVDTAESCSALPRSVSE